MIVVFFYSTDLFKGLFVILLIVNGFQYEICMSSAKAKVMINPESMHIAIISDNFRGEII